MPDEETVQDLGIDTTGIHSQSILTSDFHLALKDISVELRKINNSLKIELLETAEYIDDMKNRLLVHLDRNDDFRNAVRRGYQPVLRFGIYVRQLQRVFKRLKHVITSHKSKMEEILARNPRACDNTKVHFEVIEEIQNQVATFDHHSTLCFNMLCRNVCFDKEEHVCVFLSN